jgi:enterochelin esterase-like enzyme
MRPTVVCFVSDNRGKGSNYPEQRQTYATAMATELVPWLRTTYAVSADPRNVVIGGYSAGADEAVDVAMNYSGVFGNVLVQSGARKDLPALASVLPKVPVRIYIDIGLYEGGTWRSLPREEQAVTPVPAGDWPYVLYVLLSNGYDVTYKETAGAHEGIHWAATLAEGLIALLGK